MSSETTPLTTTYTHGPTYVFPGGVSPQARRNKLQNFQCCVALTIICIIFGAIIFALVLTDRFLDPESPPILNLALNETLPLPPSANESAIRAVLAAQNTPLDDESESTWALNSAHINREQGEAAVSAGIKALGDRELLEEGLQPTPVNSPAFRHYRSLSTTPESRKLARRGYVENRSTVRIAQMFNYTKRAGRSNIGHGPNLFLPDPTANFSCNFNARYRSANGFCNNKAHPRDFGAALIPFRRMVLPDYADGIGLPRASHNASRPLPSAREVSLKIHRSTYETDSNFTVMLAVFGQFLDHDITATSLTTSQEGESIDCCVTLLHAHPDCFPVIIMPDDPYYEQFNITCMNFVRSAPAPTGHFGPRQQFNQATAFIDGSVVYGNTDERHRNLRTLINGTLRMFDLPDGRQLLPIATSPEDGCNQLQMAREGKYCFESGDDRANENLLLTSMHLLWARQHNFLARGLQEANPDWDDETVFQEARRILAAQVAHITYNEFLPILLGRDMAEKKGLLPYMDNLDAPDTYDSKVDPTIANCFAAAAFRFAHTLLPGLFNMTRDNSTPEAIELHQMLFNPFSLYDESGFDSALITAANTPVMRVDRFFSVEVTQKLFEGTEVPVCGLDLVSLNIQRGRDHGLPSYPVFRRHCKLPAVNTWEEMSYAVDAASLESMRQIYSTPYDVDVYTGALSEPPLEGAIFGPLLTCLVSDQFLRLKQGDSHWYERKYGPQRFTKDQLRELYKTTLSEIICRNSDNIQHIRKYVMEHRTQLPNEYVECSQISAFNFTPWEAAQQPPLFYRARVSQPLTLVRVVNNMTANHNRIEANITTKRSKQTTTTTVPPVQEEGSILKS